MLDFTQPIEKDQILIQQVKMACKSGANIHAVNGAIGIYINTLPIFNWRLEAFKKGKASKEELEASTNDLRIIIDKLEQYSTNGDANALKY